MQHRIFTKNKLCGIDAVVLCGGRGRRLHEAVRDVPKPMAKIGKEPFLQVLIDYISSFGVSSFILATGHKAHIIRGYFTGYRSGDLNISFSRESEPLGTGGALKKTESLIKSDPFLVFNGDSFMRLDFVRLVKFHLKKRSMITMVLASEGNPRGSGSVFLGADQRISYFKEKAGRACGRYLNCGIYVCSKKIFDIMPPRKSFSLENDFFPAFIKNRFYGYMANGVFLDIGTPCKYRMAEKILTKKSK